jgi:hypothetical protein
MSIDRTFFFRTLREPLFGGVISESQVVGTEDILDAWEKWRLSDDLRFLAYILATAYHETANAMQPVREEGRGARQEYGKVVGLWHQIYYGRGLAQLTWQRNYRLATQRLRAHAIIGADVDLEREADLALRPDLAVAILIFGMIEGWFTGVRLRTYFSATEANWIDARRIVNGTDCASKIAGYGRLFYAALAPPALSAAA